MKVFHVDSLYEFVEFRRFSSDLAGSASAYQDSSRDPLFHGHYPKFSARLHNQRFIMKFGKSQAYPLLAEAELMSNRVADILGIRIAQPFGLITYKKRKCFVVRNFLDAGSAQNLLHLWDIWPEFAGQKAPYHLETLLELIKTQVGSNEISDYCRVMADLGHSPAMTLFQGRLRIKFRQVINAIESCPVNSHLKSCLIDLIRRRAEDILTWK